MEKYKVNINYHEFVSKSEKSVIEFDGTYVTIKLLWHNISDIEIENIKSVKPFFQLYVKNGIIFVLIKFPHMEWIDIPYVANELNLPKLNFIYDENYGYGCNILIADAKTGKLLGKRLTGFSHGFSKAFYFAVSEQIKTPITKTVEKINAIHASFHANDLARLSLGCHK